MSQISKRTTSGGGPSPLLTLTFDSGGAVSPDGSGNITFDGHTDLNFVGNPGTHSAQAYNWTKFSPYVVGTNATQYRFTSIQAAITQAIADGSSLFNAAIIYITKGNYFESVTVPASVNLIGVPSDTYALGSAGDYDSVFIFGSITFTAQFIGTLANFAISNNSGDAITDSGFSGFSELTLSNIAASGGASAYAVNISSFNSLAIHDSYVAGINTNATIDGVDSIISSANGSASNFNGATTFSFCDMSTGNLNITANSKMTQCIANSLFLNITNSATVQIEHIQWDMASTATSVDTGCTLNLSHATLSSVSPGSPFIGLGTIQLSNIDYVGGYVPNTVTTQKPFSPFVAEGAQILSVTPVSVNTNADPLLHYMFAVNTGAAVTITLPSAPNQGQTFIVKDATGTAATHNITVAGNTHNIDGAANFVMTTNWGSLTVIFNGTIWNIT